MVRIDIEPAIQRFLEGELRAGKADTTLRNYRADLAGLARTVGPRATGPALAGAVKRHLDGLELASASWNRHLTTLRRFLGYLLVTGVIDDNPLDDVKRIDVEPTAPRMATARDVRRLIGGVASRRDRALVLLLWQTGLRVGEALRLRAGDLDERKGWVTVPPPEPRRVPLPDEALHAIRDYLASRRPAGADDPMFVAQGGRPLSYAGAHRLFRQYAGSSGVTMQSMRGRAAAQAFDDGASIRHVQRMLGHRCAASTIRYYAAFHIGDSTSRNRKPRR